jgi:hypothetical protein
MDEDIDFTEDFRLFPGVDLSLWVTFAVVVTFVALFVGLVSLVVALVA